MLSDIDIFGDSAQKAQHFMLQIVVAITSDIVVQLVMFQFLYFDELDIFLALLRQVLLVEQPCLFDRYDLVGDAVHDQYFSVD